MTGLLIAGRMVDPRASAAPGWIAIDGDRVAATGSSRPSMPVRTAESSSGRRPAQAIGLARLGPGAPADIVLLGESGETVCVLRLGRRLEPARPGGG